MFIFEFIIVLQNFLKFFHLFIVIIEFLNLINLNKVVLVKIYVKFIIIMTVKMQYLNKTN